MAIFPRRVVGRVSKRFRVAPYILGTVLLCLVLLFNSPVRNTVIIPWPRAWRELSTFQVLKMKHFIYSFRFPVTLSVACVINADDAPGENRAEARLTGGRQSQVFNRLQSAVQKIDKLSSEPLTPRFEDMQMHADARRWVNASSERRAKYGRYLPIMSLEDKALLVRMWRVLDIACRAANISYFFVEGTLLGAYRHRGIIPWDDDIDVAVHVRDANKIRQALSCLRGYTLRVQDNMHWKFFPVDGEEIPGVCPDEGDPTSLSSVKTSHKRPEMMTSSKRSLVSSCVTNAPRYPFVDIFLLTSDDSYTWALTDYTLPTMVYHNDDIFPLSYVTFEGFLAPVPRRTAVVLGVNYDLDICFSPFHNHRLNKGLDSEDIVSVPCRELVKMYRMVTIW